MSEAGQPDIWRGVKVALFVTLTGPPLGALMMLVFGSARVIAANGIGPWGSIDIAGLASVAVWVSVFSYVFGGLPALISGIALGIRAAKGQPTGILLTLAIVGVSLLITAVAFRVLPFRSDPLGNVVALIAVLTPLAAASALVCRWLMIKIRLLPSI